MKEHRHSLMDGDTQYYKQEHQTYAISCFMRKQGNSYNNWNYRQVD